MMDFFYKNIVNICLIFFTFLVVFVSCSDDKKGEGKSEYFAYNAEVKKHIDSSYCYRHIDLPKAFEKAYFALNVCEQINPDSLKCKSFENTVKYNISYGYTCLNMANLYYWCNHFDSVYKYRDEYDKVCSANFYERLEDSLKTKKTDSLCSMGDKEYLKFLRDIQQVEVDLRLMDFTSIYFYLQKHPEYHKYKYYLEESWECNKKKNYGNYYKSNEWHFAKIHYNIKYASYNFYYESENKYENLEDAFDGIYQLSRAKEDIDSLDYGTEKTGDKSTFYNYYYTLANCYERLAKTLSDTLNKNEIVYELQKYLTIKFDTTSIDKEKKIAFDNFYFEEEKVFLKKQAQEIKGITGVDSLNAIRESVTNYFWQKAVSIYDSIYHKLITKDSTLLYWKANYLQNMASILDIVKKKKLKTTDHSYLNDTTKKLNYLRQYDCFI